MSLEDFHSGCLDGCHPSLRCIDGNRMRMRIITEQELNNCASNAFNSSQLVTTCLPQKFYRGTLTSVA